MKTSQKALLVHKLMKELEQELLSCGPDDVAVTFQCHSDEAPHFSVHVGGDIKRLPYFKLNSDQLIELVNSNGHSDETILTAKAILINALGLQQ